MPVLVKKPAKEQYLAACNELWWCTNNIAKGLWREEILYVQDMINHAVRNQLIILNWNENLFPRIRGNYLSLLSFLNVYRRLFTTERITFIS